MLSDVFPEGNVAGDTTVLAKGEIRGNCKDGIMIFLFLTL
jgi:hypothetical protein